MRSSRNVLIFGITLSIFFGCVKKTPELVVYTSLDEVLSEPIFLAFEEQTGIKVKVFYDLDSTETTGLVNRLIAEKDNPQADIFWNSEIVGTIILKNKGVLEPYISAQAQDIPNKFKDSDGYWTGFSARARILIYNKDQLISSELPQSIFELTEPHWSGKVALAYPLYGTTVMHAASLFVYFGDNRAEQFFRDLKDNDVVIVDSNSTSGERVQEGELSIGFTDTDIANVALLKGKPIGIIYHDQRADQVGLLLIPNTVALIQNAPHPEEAKKFIDYLLSSEVESQLAFSEAAQIPFRDNVERPEGAVSYQQIKAMEVDFEEVAEKIEYTRKILQDIFAQ